MALGTAFVLVERRSAQPMLDLSLFSKPAFAGASIAAFALSASMFAMFLYLTLYIQNILGYSPLESGLRFLPVTLLSFMIAPVSGKLAERLGIRWFLGAGLFCVGLGLFLMSGLEVGDDWTALLAGFLVAGGGIGLVNPPLATAAVGVVEPQRAGMASGINSTFRQVGIATGIAGLGAVFQHLVASDFLERVPASRLPPGVQADAIADFISFGGAQRAGNPALARRGRAGVRPRAQPHPRLRGHPGLRGRAARDAADAPAGLRGARCRGRGRMIPLTARAFAEAAANVYDGTFGEGLADLRRMPSTVIDAGPQGTLHRYHPAAPRRPARRCRCCSCRRSPRPRCASTCAAAARSPSTSCWRAGRPTSSTMGRSSSPTARSASSTGSRTSCRAIRAASKDAGGRPVQVVGWCLGGILSLLALAADRDLPVASAALVASPFDFSKVPLVAPLRPIAAVTGGAGITQLYRLLGGAPAPLVKRGYQLAGIEKHLMKPWTVLSNLHDRELLAQIEAVDAFMDRMHAYPGRTFGQLYHRFFRTNDLADGRFAVTGGTLDLADVHVPVLSVAGRGDGIAPVAACHHVESLLTHARVELATAPGGHLGVLTGRAAAGTTWQTLDGFLDAPGPAKRRAGRAKRGVASA